MAHGCTGKGNDQVRFEHAFQALAPELKVIAPWREWKLKSREDCLDYAEQHGIAVAASREKIHSRDRNIWHLSHEGGELEDPANAPYESTWQLTRSPQEAPDREAQHAAAWRLGAQRWARCMVRTSLPLPTGLNTTPFRRLEIARFCTVL